jgi:copper(I)-binding protein
MNHRLLRTVLATAVTVALLTGCGRWRDAPVNQPGANAATDGLLVRYLHVAEPPPGRQHPAGADVPMYVWLYNRGPTDERLLGVRTAVSSDVVLERSPDTGSAAGGLPLRIPAGGAALLRPGEDHLVLRDVTEPLRGGEFVDVTLRFERVGPVDLRVQVQPPPYDDDPWTPAPTPA